MKATKDTHEPSASQSDIANGARVLETEIAGLQKLKTAIDETFSQAVEIINAMKEERGRLIVAGIGKSGHVARKIAATMASTGTPAHFVHPGEASHGDLGMITENDVVLMLSNSGENAELSDLIHYTRRFGMKLIAMTGNENGSLAKHADVVLLLPKSPEACPNGLAPTTSTTMMMALGDALAVALLERMGLTPEQFHAFHPGGKLGKKLLKISDVMQGFDALPIASAETLMKETLITMTQKNLGCVLILSKDGALNGIITDGDLKRHLQTDDNLLTKKAGDIMSKSPKTINADALAVEAVNVMTKTPGHYLTSLVVLEGKKVAGLIRLQDCLRAGLV
jgi:arabinose-5-phosphate isomerase